MSRCWRNGTGKSRSPEIAKRNHTLLLEVRSIFIEGNSVNNRKEAAPFARLLVAAV